MNINICEMCGKKTKFLHEHHTLPRFLGGTDNDIIKVCRSCHKKADGKFLQFILNPFNENSYGKASTDPKYYVEYYTQRKEKGYWQAYHQKHRKHRIATASKFYYNHREQRLEYQKNIKKDIIENTRNKLENISADTTEKKG